MHYRTLVLGLSALLVIATQSVAAAEKPNVILIMADDLGYQDLSCYGSERNKTPVLDKLAGEGIRLTSFYAGATVCTPSRMALLTGAYPPRLGWHGGVVGYGIKVVNGLSPEALTIAEVFKAAGYQSGMIGKWHLGDTPELSPMKQGFDLAFYIKQSNNQCKQLWRNEDLVADPFDNRRLTESFTSEAIKFIEAHQTEPFLLYLPLTAPHFPAQAHPDWKGKSDNGQYGDVVEELDSSIGKILETLNRTELDKKTIVVFLSDNGPEPGQKSWAQAKPYRGLKWSSLEGGTRVPCIIRYPNIIKAGQESDEIIAAIDLLPTLAHVCGIDLRKVSPECPKIDGVNVWDTLTGKDDISHARTDLLYWDGWATPQAIRVGDWKLYLDRVKQIEGSDIGPVLIHLTEDPSEETNLSDRHPEKVTELKTLAEKQLLDIEEHRLPMGGPPLSK